MRVTLHAPRLHPWVALSLALIMLVFLVYSVNKTWRSFTVLNNARALGVEQAADLRANDTVGHLIDHYRINPNDLAEVVGHPLPHPSVTLRDIAERDSVDELLLIERVQEKVPKPIVVELSDDSPPTLYDQFVTSVFNLIERYGLPMLLIVVFLGALGLPVPAGPVAALVGVMAFEGLFNGVLVALSILGVAVIGDVLLFVVGRQTRPESLLRYGRFMGYTAKNRLRVEHLFQRWGGLTLFITRSLVAHISAVVSVLAGASTLSYRRYVSHCVIGRAFWLLIYFGFGYFVGGNVGMASGFLGYFAMSLSGLLALLLLLELYIIQHPRPFDGAR